LMQPLQRIFRKRVKLPKKELGTLITANNS